MARLTEQEQQEVIRFVEAGKPVPDKYRFFAVSFGFSARGSSTCSITWNGSTTLQTSSVFPFQTSSTSRLSSNSKWCADASALDGGQQYKPLFVREEDWEQYKPKTLHDAIAAFSS